MIFTDWRQLARPGESYNGCAYRVFGDTMAPSLVRAGAEESSRELTILLRAIANSPEARIESFATGHHPFAEALATRMPAFQMPSRARKSAPSVPARRREERLEEPERPFSVALEAFSEQIASALTRLSSGLQRLILHLDVSTDLDRHGDKERYYHLLEMLIPASILTHLTLNTQDHNRSTYYPDDYRPTIRVLRAVLNDFYSSYLQTINLRGWTISSGLLRSFLQRHAGTLRVVRLENCFVDCDGIELAEWAGENLLLNGVDLNLSFGFEVHEPRGFRWEHIDRDDPEILLARAEHLWLAGRQNLIVRERSARTVGHESDEDMDEDSDEDIDEDSAEDSDTDSAEDRW